MKAILIVFIITTFIGCNGQDCNNLKTDFRSYESALKEIRNTSFTFSDNCDTSKSSWIKGAEYYSCDLKTGFMLMQTSTTTYTHANVPIEVWKEFKNADSFGSFYSTRIKGRYQLILK